MNNWSEKEMKLFLLGRAEKNLEMNRGFLSLVRDEAMRRDAEADLDKEAEFLENWKKEIQG